MVGGLGWIMGKQPKSRELKNDDILGERKPEDFHWEDVVRGALGGLGRDSFGEGYGRGSVLRQSRIELDRGKLKKAQSQLLVPAIQSDEDQQDQPLEIGHGHDHFEDPMYAHNHGISHIERRRLRTSR